jgi:hypothetical protein
MEPTTEQFERIGRYLDGESIALSEVELDLARQIRQDDAIVAPALDCPMPAATSHLLRRQARQAMVRPRTAIRITLDAAAVAAAVLLVIALVWPSHDRPLANNPNAGASGGAVAVSNPPGNDLAVWAQDASQGEHGMYELMSAMTMDNVELEMAIETAATASDPLAMADMGG